MERREEKEGGRKEGKEERTGKEGRKGRMRNLDHVGTKLVPYTF